MTKPTKWHVCPAKTRSAWAFAQSDQSLCCPHEESLGLSLPIERMRTDQTGRTDHVVGFVMRQLIHFYVEIQSNKNCLEIVSVIPCFLKLPM